MASVTAVNFDCPGCDIGDHRQLSGRKDIACARLGLVGDDHRGDPSRDRFQCHEGAEHRHGEHSSAEREAVLHVGDEKAPQVADLAVPLAEERGQVFDAGCSVIRRALERR